MHLNHFFLSFRIVRTSYTHKPNCFGQKNYCHTKRIRICVLFRIRIQNNIFYPDNSLSLQFSATPLTQFFSPSILATTLPQINCYYFFFSHFGNSIATNQLPQFFFSSFSATSLPKLLLNFSPSFRQLGYHNSLFFFFLSFSATWFTQLVSLSSTPPSTLGTSPSRQGIRQQEF